MKVVVTTQNVTKLSEEALIHALDQLPDDDEMLVVIEAELDRRADIIIKQAINAKSRKAKDDQLLVQLKSEVSELFTNMKQGKVIRLIELFGDEFSGDYDLNHDTFVLISHAESPFPGNNKRWEHDSLEDALHHLRELLRWRIYYKYTRNATVESLSRIKTSLENLG
jgi:hypothetical protein